MDLCDIRTIKALLGRHGFRFSKSMGQNFLIEDWVPRDIADASGASPDSGVLEIGPGIGPLTAQLCVRAGKVAAVELDRSLLPVLDETLADCSNVEILPADAPNPEKSASAVTGPCELFMPLGELVDVEKEIARLQKDKKNVEGEIARAQGKLNNQGFVSKAPAHLIEQEKQKLETNKGLLVKLDARIAEMEALR